MSLNELKIGEEAKILSIDIIDKEMKRHLLDMGLTRGVTVKMKKISPMGDPVGIYLRGYDLCVRRKELSKIKCEVIK